MKLNRFILIGIFILTIGKILAQQQKKILFICEHGSVMSPVATLYFNKYAKERGLPWRATFKGLHPDAVLNTAVQDGLKKEGFDIRGLEPQPLSDADIREADRVITMNFLLQGRDTLSKPVRLWNIFPMEDGYEGLRKVMDRKVKMLISDIENVTVNSNKSKDAK